MIVPATLTDPPPELAEALELPLLGVPLLYRSNSPAAIAAVEAALGRWRRLPAALVAAGPPALVELVVQPGDPGGPAPTGALARAHGDTLLATLGGSLMVARPAEGRALALLTPGLAADGAALGRQVAAPLGLLLAAARDRTPLRARGLARGGRALLLVGEAGVDPASLWRACLGAGFAPLADEAAYVSTAGELRVWGHPWPPAGHPPATHAGRPAVVLVAPGAGQASRLEPVSPAVAAAALASPWPGLDLLRGRAAAAAAAVAAAAYRLRAGADPGAAAMLLAHLADGGLA